MKRLITSVWFLGLVIAIPVILALPGIFSKYRISLVSQETAAHKINYRIRFRDLDGNGVKQKIYAFPNSVGQLSFQYFGDDGRMINQVSFSRKFAPNIFFLFLSDVNRNGKTEVYGFTYNQDSLFLNWIELFNPDQGSSKSLFISKFGVVNESNINVSVNRFLLEDIDNDGNFEIIFSIVTGYSIFPRQVVIYHPETGKLFKSEDIGINPFFLSFYDLDMDGKLEMLASSGAGYNLNDSTGNLFLDDRPYLLAFNSDLTLRFPPVPFSAGINNHIRFFMNSPERNEIVVFQFNRSLPSEKTVGIYKVDYNGTLKDSVFLPEFGKIFAYQVFRDGSDFWLYTGDKMVRIDKLMNVTEVRNIEASTQMFQNTVLRKGFPEYFTGDELSKKACIYTENFKHRVEINYHDETIRNFIPDTGQGDDHFMIQTDSNEYMYRFRKNFIYYLKFPAFLAIYLLSVLFISLVQGIREKQLSERFEMQNQLRNMEIKSLRMQMDPHFMFNAFTTMALLIKNGDRNEAFDSFMKFTRMLRSNFDFSDYLTRPLNEELQTVRDYLEINKLRFKDKLNFEVKIDEDVPGNNLVPKMILQIHVENALKHGLSQLERPGMIRIAVFKEGEFIRLSVEDNGIGRQKAASLNRPSTKQGIKMLHALMDRLNQQNKLKITQNYTDLEGDSGKPSGTKVELWVPINLKELTEV